MSEERYSQPKTEANEHTVGALGIAAVSFETDQTQYDAFGDMLPLMLSTETPERSEPRYDQLDPGRTLTKYTEKIAERERLFREGKVTAANGVIILYSDVGEKTKTITKNGKEREVSDYFHSEAEGKEHLGAAKGLVHTITETMRHDADQVVIRQATREAIDEALADPRIGHMIFIGHANRSQLTIDPIYTYNWQETPPLTHLKKSFGVFGCGTLKNEKFYPRIGSTFVSPDGVLYGVKGDYLDEGQPYQFDQLVRHSLDVLEGTPLNSQISKAG